MTDLRIELVVKDVSRGDIESIKQYLTDIGPNFDMSKGDFSLIVYERDNASRQWFYVVDE